MICAKKFRVDMGWKLILKNLQIDINELLKCALLPLDLFVQKNAILSTEEYFRLWNSLEKLSQNKLFPLHLGQAISSESFNPPIFAALCSANLNIAMERLSLYKQLIGPMILNVVQNKYTTTVSLDCLYTDQPLPDSLVMAEITFLIHLVRLATRENIIPFSVDAATPKITQKAYKEYFGVLAKHSKYNRIVFRSRDAVQPFLTENKGMWLFFEPELRKRLSEIDVEINFSERVHSCLLELLPSGLSSAQDVAKKLAVSKRTLQRNLHSENTNFRSILDTTRAKLAHHYLQHTTLPNEQIAFLLGFQDPNSFVRAFRSWTGKTPKKMRG